MKYLRTASTSRLLAMIVGLVVAIGAGTAIAVAAAGRGPVPAAKSLSLALHDAAAAPKVTGITADISFTNNLIGSTAFAGGPKDPILQGATGRLWLSGDGRLRLELQSDNGDAQIVVNHNAFWVSDPSSSTVYEGTLPAQHSAAKSDSASQGLPSVAQIQSDLNRLMGHADVSGANPSDVAGQPAYTVSLSPKHAAGLLGSAQVAWDAVHGVPLRVAVYARGNATPVLELKATNISYGAVPASDFSISPPSSDKVVKVSTAGANTSSAQGARVAKAAKARHHREVSGVGAVAAALPFKLVAPSTLVGLPRQSVKLLDWGGKPAALVTYGENLGGIAVIEQPADPAAQTAPKSGGGQSAGDPRGLSLPTVSINGATGQELDTALGTVVRFSRGAVAYTVLGSVPAAAADAAARGL